MACMVYAQEKNGTLPRAWDELKPYVGGDAGLKLLLTCPAHRGAGTVDYTLLAGGRKLAELPQPSNTLLIRESGPAHNGRRTVGYADGRVEVQNTALSLVTEPPVEMPATNEPPVEAAPK